MATQMSKEEFLASLQGRYNQLKDSRTISAASSGKRRSAMTETMMNTLMCTRNWLGIQEITQEEMVAERDCFVQYEELSNDGDIIEG